MGQRTKARARARAHANAVALRPWDIVITLIAFNDIGRRCINAVGDRPTNQSTDRSTDRPIVQSSSSLLEIRRGQTRRRKISDVGSVSKADKSVSDRHGDKSLGAIRAPS